MTTERVARGNKKGSGGRGVVEKSKRKKNKGKKGKPSSTAAETPKIILGNCNELERNSSSIPFQCYTDDHDADGIARVITAMSIDYDRKTRTTEIVVRCCEISIDLRGT